jgi:protein-L-isoaspartate(D-aspartate) O-methyltransferase
MKHRDYQIARERMVREQVFERGVADRNVLRALLEVPRHLFLDRNAGPEAYTDHALPIGYSQTMSQPYMVAYLADQLALSGRETVLEIGTGSGYQAAVLAHLAKAVYTIERIAELAQRARTTVADLGYRNVHVKTADGADGWIEYAPFDRILLTAAAVGVPEGLLEQVVDGGFLLGPVVVDDREQRIVRLRRRGDRFEIEKLQQCAFVPLIRGEPQPTLEDRRP